MAAVLPRVLQIGHELPGFMRVVALLFCISPIISFAFVFFISGDIFLLTFEFLMRSQYTGTRTREIFFIIREGLENSKWHSAFPILYSAEITKGVSTRYCGKAALKHWHPWNQLSPPFSRLWDSFALAVDPGRLGREFWPPSTLFFLIYSIVLPIGEGDLLSTRILFPPSIPAVLDFLTMANSDTCWTGFSLSQCGVIWRMWE